MSACTANTFKPHKKRFTTSSVSNAIIFLPPYSGFLFFKEELYA